MCVWNSGRRSRASFFKGKQVCNLHRKGAAWGASQGGPSERGPFAAAMAFAPFRRPHFLFIFSTKWNLTQGPNIWVEWKQRCFEGTQSQKPRAALISCARDTPWEPNTALNTSWKPLLFKWPAYSLKAGGESWAILVEERTFVLTV